MCYCEVNILLSLLDSRSNTKRKEGIVVDENQR